MEWEWRVVPLKDMFPGELLSLCVRKKDVGPEEVLRAWRDAKTAAESSADRGRQDDGAGRGESQPAGGGGPKRSGESPVRSGDARVPDVPLAVAAVQGRPGSERASGRREREDVIDVDAEPPPPPSVGTSSIRRLRIAALGQVRSRRYWERGRQQDRPGLRVRLPERQFPAESAVGRWACLRVGVPAVR